jgi:class 3 adenylate cyclase
LAKTKIPRYYGLRIYLIAVLLYLLLVFPIAMIMLFKYGPYWMEERGFNARELTTSLTQNAPASPLSDTLALQGDKAEESNEIRLGSIDSNEIRFGESIGLLLRLLLASFILGFAWHLPFKRLLHLKRKGKPIKKELLSFCRRWLIYTPIVNSAILGLGFAISLIYMGFQVFQPESESAVSQQFHIQFFYISLLASLLSVLFVYFWQKHRVRFKYLDYVFDSLSLYKANAQNNESRIKYRLWISSAMTTLLPLSIVVFYLFLSTTAVKEMFQEQLTQEQTIVLFGKYLHFIQMTDFEASAQNLFYVNTIDSLLMFVGIFTGILISIIYLFFFVHWTTQSIAVPMGEILGKMKESGEGKLGRLAIVRTPDEFGRLATGFNEMAVRISRNIDELKEITQANQRFVPDEFLQLMGKKSITEVSLGDQVQKTMTMLFIDIHAFTSISESMSPRENFNFLNNYLGFMEPEIRKHHGFIDKFIGDSIMALFENKPDDAIDAAIAMRHKLTDFNLLLKQTGRPEIETGTGIHMGKLMLGVVGGESRMETTVISDAVNLASRLEGLTREYNAGIIISANTLEQINNKEKYTYRYLDKVLVKGRKEAVRIFEIFAPDFNCPPSSYIVAYHEAIELLNGGEFKRAREIFVRLLLEYPGDFVVKKHKQHCEKMLNELNTN